MVSYNLTMNIVIVGTGYVGLVGIACLADLGNKVTGVDIDKEKISKLKKGIVPIYEPGLEELLEKNKNNITFTTDISEALKDADVVFIAVGTPSLPNGQADLKYVKAVARSIGEHMQKPLIVIDKSTVPVGTAKVVKNIIAKKLKERSVNIDFDVVSNPEFLKEGSAISDFMHPDRIVVGSNKQESIEKLRKLYAPIIKNGALFIAMDPASAELTKYAANSILATKISFINEIAKIAERAGADIDKVKQGIGSDKRIGYHFINAGIGFGGSCFPKDVSALIETAKQLGIDPILLQSVLKVNDLQQQHFANKIIQFFNDLKDPTQTTIAVWGVTFKPNTDDIRKSPAINIIKILAEYGFNLKVYDPQGLKHAQKTLKGFKNITYHNSAQKVLEDADALAILTDWQEFKEFPIKQIEKGLNKPVVFDGRNIFSKEHLQSSKILYLPIGKPKHLNLEYILKDLTVLIPAYNEAPRIKKALLPLLKAGIRTIVVNDASTDNTRNILLTLKKQYSNLTVISLAKNQGKFKALQIGFNRVRSPYILFSDADVSFNLKPIIHAYKTLYYIYDDFMVVFNSYNTLLDKINTKALSGIRILSTRMAQNIFELGNKHNLTKKSKGYLIETLMNKYVISNKIARFYCPLNYIHVMKSQKWGMLYGLIADSKMVFNIFTHPWAIYNLYATTLYKKLKNCPLVKATKI